MPSLPADGLANPCRDTPVCYTIIAIASMQPAWLREQHVQCSAQGCCSRCARSDSASVSYTIT